MMFLNMYLLYLGELITLKFLMYKMTYIEEYEKT